MDDAKEMARKVYALLSGSVMKSLPTEKLDDAVGHYGHWEPIIAASDGHLRMNRGLIEIAGRFK